MHADRTMPADPASTTRAASRPRRAAPVGIAAAGLALALATVAGCRSVETVERPFTLRVETVPPKAEVLIAVPGAGREAKAVGRSPVSIEGLEIVRKTFVSGQVRYWLADRNQRLPQDPSRPAFASEPYAAGADYPLELVVTAELGAGRTAERRVVIDRALLASLFETGRETLVILLRLDPEGARAIPGSRPILPTAPEGSKRAAALPSPDPTRGG